MRALAPLPNFRTLFAMFVALAALLAPATSAGEAFAAFPHHDVQMARVGHCHAPASPDAGHHQGDMSCCTAMSLGVTAAVQRPAEEALDPIAPASAPVSAPHRPFIGELATPPPRST